jgi:hypothetical protein
MVVFIIVISILTVVGIASIVAALWRRHQQKKKKKKRGGLQSNVSKKDLGVYAQFDHESNTTTYDAEDLNIDYREYNVPFYKRWWWSFQSWKNRHISAHPPFTSAASNRSSGNSPRYTIGDDSDADIEQRASNAPAVIPMQELRGRSAAAQAAMGPPPTPPPRPFVVPRSAAVLTVPVASAGSQSVPSSPASVGGSDIRFDTIPLGDVPAPSPSSTLLYDASSAKQHHQ